MGWLEIPGRLAHDPSPFMHHSLYSIFLAVTFFVLVTEFSKAEQLWLKIFISLFALSALVNLFLNGGRLGQLAFFLALLVYIFMKFRLSLKTFIVTIGIIVAIFVSAYTISPIFQKRMDMSVASVQKMLQGNFSSSWGSRVYALIIAKDIVLEHPLLGVGIGSAKEKFVEQTKAYPHGKMVQGFWHMHNQYMQILLETGVVGLILFFVFLYQLLNISLPRALYIMLWSFVVIYLFGFIGEPLFWNRQPYMLFNFFVAYFLFVELHMKQNHNVRSV
jgi:O-antigen ligase